MIKNNLAVLMASRGIKIQDVHETTNISRNTLSSFANNKATGIQYETIEKLCNYFGVTPNDLLSIIPFEITLNRFEYSDPNGRLKLYTSILYQTDKTDAEIDVDFNLMEVTYNTINTPPALSLYIVFVMQKNIYDKIAEVPEVHITTELFGIILDQKLISDHFMKGRRLTETKLVTV